MTISESAYQNPAPAKHVVMILSNAYKPDPRVQREAIGLRSAGYRVTIVCWDRAKELPAKEHRDGISIIRVHDVQSDYGSGWRQVSHLPRFWQKAERIALRLQPEFVHCHDLDTLFVGRRLAKVTNCRLIYDAHEHYPALMSLYLPALMIPLLSWWEKWLMKNVDATITASTVLADIFADAGHAPVMALGNYPSFSRFSEVDQADVMALRASLACPPERLLVAYIAGFHRNRMLISFIEAAGLCADVDFHIWGGGIQEAAVEAAAARFQNVHYHGWAAPEDLPQYFHVADVIYYGLRLDYPGAIYNAPNTLAQAMAAGRPIIGTDVGDLGRIVKETGAGILIDEATPQAIAKAIDKLREPALRQKLGEAGREAARREYNTESMYRKLAALYQRFLSECAT